MDKRYLPLRRAPCLQLFRHIPAAGVASQYSYIYFLFGFELVLLKSFLICPRHVEALGSILYTYLYLLNQAFFANISQKTISTSSKSAPLYTTGT